MNTNKYKILTLKEYKEIYNNGGATALQGLIPGVQEVTIDDELDMVALRIETLTDGVAHILPTMEQLRKAFDLLPVEYKTDEDFEKAHPWMAPEENPEHPEHGTKFYYPDNYNCRCGPIDNKSLPPTFEFHISCTKCGSTFTEDELEDLFQEFETVACECGTLVIKRVDDE